jgi:hypothetical protein
VIAYSLRGPEGNSRVVVDFVRCILMSVRVVSSCVVHRSEGISVPVLDRQSASRSETLPGETYMYK